MPKLRTLTTEEVRILPRRVLGQRDQKSLAEYRSHIRKMTEKSDGQRSALELSSTELKRVQTIKRWLRRAAQEEGIRIKIQKRGELLIFERDD